LRYQRNQANNFFFKWDKNLIKEKHWASLPLAAKAIFPVIAVHYNKMGECWPSQKTIAELSGYTEKTVREGIKGLLENGFSGMKLFKIKKAGMLWPGVHYQIDSTPIGKKGYFPFHKSLIIGKKWSRLTHSAQALYPAMRCFGYNDGFGPNYRPHDYCDREKKFLAEYAGISTKSIPTALRSLQKMGLIIPVQRQSAWRVFID